MKIVHGDILTSSATDKDKFTIVCHQVNCKGIMGAGLARQIRIKHPWVYEVYKDKCESTDNPEDLLGNVLFVSCLDESGYLVANLFGQIDVGRYSCQTDYDALRCALREVGQAFSTDCIRIPYGMGCGLAGGDWDIVSQIIQEELIDKGVEVEIWKLDSNKVTQQ